MTTLIVAYLIILGASGYSLYQRKTAAPLVALLTAAFLLIVTLFKLRLP